MLGRLAHRGAVIRRPGGPHRLYSAAQRLYSIYYKLRRERDQAAAVRSLLRFMTVFYTGDTRAEVAWKAPYPRMAAPSAWFCTGYAALAPELETMAPAVIEGVSILLAGGVPESEVIAILRTEPEKAAALAPLIVALRRRQGETVRAPAEGLEVADDVSNRIAELPGRRT